MSNVWTQQMMQIGAGRRPAVHCGYHFLFRSFAHFVGVFARGKRNAYMSYTVVTHVVSRLLCLACGAVVEVEAVGQLITGILLISAPARWRWLICFIVPLPLNRCWEFSVAAASRNACPILLSRTLSVMPVGPWSRSRLSATDNRNTFNLCARKVALVDLLYSSSSAHWLLEF